jgi:hypothetical protein
VFTADIIMNHRLFKEEDRKNRKSRGRRMGIERVKEAEETEDEGGRNK